MTMLTWPHHILKPIEIGLDLEPASRSPGEPWAGHEQIITPLTNRWRLGVSFALGSEARVRVYRAIKSKLKGRYTPINFPICDPYRVHFADAGWPIPVSPGIPFSDDSFFSDDVGFAYPNILTTVATAALEGDEEITLEIATIGDALGVGHRFSIDDFLYEVTFGGFGALDGLNRTFGIAPELRADVAAGAEVRIGRPIIRCRLADDLSGGGRLHLGKFASPSMEFVEVFAR